MMILATDSGHSVVLMLISLKNLIHLSATFADVAQVLASGPV